MKRYGEEYELTQDLLDEIASYMDDEIRDFLHLEMAPCTPSEFLEKYCEHHTSFKELLDIEFDIQL